MKPRIDAKRGNVLVRGFKYFYIKVFQRYGTPHEKAIGFGLGVFLGILPGTGPLAALFLATVFRVNRAAALLGSLLTNTWVSVVAFMISIKIGALLMGVHWKVAHRDWAHFIKEFRFASLLKLSAIKIILPVAVGYLVVSLCAGILAYICIRILIEMHRFMSAKKPSKPTN
jgi:uncharacterized protein (DUF2062 family)